MPLQIIHKDITEMAVDAIVNPTDSFYSGSGGTDYAVHYAAGKELDYVCQGLLPLGFGEVAVTDSFGLPCRHIIHTMGPIWQGGDENEAILLRSCYVNALIKARRMGLESVAFPLISAGTFGFPKDRVLRIAIDAIADFLFSSDGELAVYICILDRNSFELSKDVALNRYIGRSKRFVYESHTLKMEQTAEAPMTGKECDMLPPRDELHKCDYAEEAMPSPPAYCAGLPDATTGHVSHAKAKAVPKAKKPDNLSDWIKQQDDTFAVTLLKLIDKKKMDDVDCYKKANVTKNTFWKIKNQANYKPSKPTVLAFAIALELNMRETEILLKSAGFSLSHNNLFDMIIEFHIVNGMYDIFEINAALYKYDQTCLGC